MFVCFVVVVVLVVKLTFPNFQILKRKTCNELPAKYFILYFTARASEQGNVIGLVSIYIYIYIYIYIVVIKKKIVIERTRDLIYLKFVATDFFPKIISPSVGENSGDLA